MVSIVYISSDINRSRIKTNERLIYLFAGLKLKLIKLATDVVHKTKYLINTKISNTRGSNY